MSSYNQRNQPFGHFIVGFGVGGGLFFFAPGLGMVGIWGVTVAAVALYMGIRYLMELPNKQKEKEQHARRKELLRERLANRSRAA